MTSKTRSLIFVFISIALPWYASSSIAETLYVTDTWRFEIRESPCWECRMIRSLQSGTELEGIVSDEEPVKGWKKVRTLGGTEGWISELYITDQPSAESQLTEAVEVSRVAAIEQTLLREQFALISAELLDAGVQVEMVTVTSEDGSVTIESPRMIGDLATVGHQNEELLKRNQLLQNDLDLRSAEIDRLTDMRWKTQFIYGGSAVFSGVILCLILTRIRPKKGYSEWA